MTRTLGIVLGLIGLVVGCTGCVGDGPIRIAELEPYVGAYPATPQRLRPRRPKPTEVIPVDTPRGTIRGLTIVVDAGHGGRDPGALGVWTMPEKTIVLNVAMKVVQLLGQRGARVITTRSDDTFISLSDRAYTADRHHADLFVSIHADAAKRAGATGTTVFIARAGSAQSRKTANAIVAAMERAGIESRGVKRAGFRVLVGHSRPAVLVECGFLTNRREARLLSTDSYRTKMANAIAEGIVDSFRR